MRSARIPPDAPAPVAIEQVTGESLASIPDCGGVFVLHAGGESRYLAKTAFLRRRIVRTVRMFRLAEVLSRIEAWPTASRFESALLHYDLARRLFPDNYAKLVRLARPAYVRVILGNAFPRTQVTTRLSTRGLHFGPFRTRGDAEAFEKGMLDLFQIRRCEPDLVPSPGHPGCIYGEMNMCLRPCQGVVSAEEYAGEVGRVVEFLNTGGESLLDVTSAARDRLSEEMDFEGAAREHRLVERIQAAGALRSELVGEVERLYGVAVLPALDAGRVRLQFLWKGAWLGARVFELDRTGGPMDHRLKEMLEGLEDGPVTLLERQEHLALLARWFYSSRREGEWIGFDDPAVVPWRKLVRALSRVAGGR